MFCLKPFVYAYIHLLIICISFFQLGSTEPVTCQHIDYLWNVNECCEASDDPVSCLEYIPKEDLDEFQETLDDVDQRLTTLELKQMKFKMPLFSNTKDSCTEAGLLYRTNVDIVFCVDVGLAMKINGEII